MSFSIRCFLVLILGFTGCHRDTGVEQQKIEREFETALREHAFERAEKLAQRTLELAPEENRGWDQLIQAQLGRRDFARAKQTLYAWRRAVVRPSPKLDEYAGDIARAEKDPALALRSWRAAWQVEPENARVLEKIARAHDAQRHWDESESAWSAFLHVQDSATAHVHRAIARCTCAVALSCR